MSSYLYARMKLIFNSRRSAFATPSLQNGHCQSAVSSVRFVYETDRLKPMKKTNRSIIYTK